MPTGTPWGLIKLENYQLPVTLKMDKINKMHSIAIPFLKRNEELTITKFCNRWPLIVAQTDRGICLARNFYKAFITFVCYRALLRKTCVTSQSRLGIRYIWGKAAVTYGGKQSWRKYHFSVHSNVPFPRGVKETAMVSAAHGTISIQGWTDMLRTCHASCLIN